MIDENVVTLSDQGELLITLQSGYDVQFKITSWEDGLNYFIYEHNNWCQQDIDAGIILATDQPIDSSDPTELFVANIPILLRHVASRFHYKQFSLLRIVAQYPKLEEIVVHSPNLCWMLVVFAEQEGWSIEHTASVLQLKRIQITEILFANNSPQLVKLLNKIQLINGSEGEFSFLIKVLKQASVLNTFKHWETVSMQALRVVDKKECFLNSRLLANEIDTGKTIRANLIHFSDLQSTYNDIQRLCTSLGRGFDLRIWRTMKTTRQLEQLHDRLTQQYNNSEQGRLALLERFRSQGITEDIDSPYPICPLGDFEHFVQLKNRSELAEEGIYMRHCVSSYHNNLLGGKRYIYKLLQPQRATVELSFNQSNYRITQFKLARNRKPSPDSYQYLKDLLG